MNSIDGVTEKEHINPAQDNAQSSPLNTEEPAKPRPKTGGRQKKRRGAPLGNQNARKHGFYSRILSPVQAAHKPEVLSTEGLTLEIAALRLKIAEVIAYPKANPQLVLRAMGMLSRLLEIEAKIKRIY